MTYEIPDMKHYASQGLDKLFHNGKDYKTGRSYEWNLKNLVLWGVAGLGLRRVYEGDTLIESLWLSFDFVIKNLFGRTLNDQ